MPRGAAAYDDAERMLDEQRPDVVYVAVPPSAAIAACEAVVARGIPFLAEKPLAATDAGGPGARRGRDRRARARGGRGLPPALARAAPRGPRPARRQPGPARHGALDRLDAAARVVAPRAWTAAARSSSRPPTSTTSPGCSSARPRWSARRRCTRRRRRRPARTSPTRRPPSCGSRPARSGRSRTRAGSRARSSTSRSRPTGSSRPSARPAPDPGAWEVELRDGADVTVLPPGRDPYEIQAETLPRCRRRRRPVGGGLDLRRRAAHRPPHAGRGRGDGRPRLTGSRWPGRQNRQRVAPPGSALMTP